MSSKVPFKIYWLYLMFPVDEYLSQHFVLPNILILIIPGVLLGLSHNLKLISLITSCG